MRVGVGEMCAPLLTTAERGKGGFGLVWVKACAGPGGKGGLLWCCGTKAMPQPRWLTQGLPSRIWMPPAHRIKPYLGFGVPVGSAYLSARRTFCGKKFWWENTRALLGFAPM